MTDLHHFPHYFSHSCPNRDPISLWTVSWPMPSTIYNYRPLLGLTGALSTSPTPAVSNFYLCAVTPQPCQMNLRIPSSTPPVKHQIHNILLKYLLCKERISVSIYTTELSVVGLVWSTLEWQKVDISTISALLQLVQLFVNYFKVNISMVSSILRAGNH